jgi:hypothetical protein
MFSQVYFHKARLALDIHLRDFLIEWLPGGRFSTSSDELLAITDNEVTAAILESARDSEAKGHDQASRIIDRRHFRVLFSPRPGELLSGATSAVFSAAEAEFGAELVRMSTNTKKSSGIEFPVLAYDGEVGSSTSVSQVLGQVPVAMFEYVFVAPERLDHSSEWLGDKRDQIIEAAESHEEEEGDEDE